MGNFGSQNVIIQTGPLPEHQGWHHFSENQTYKQTNKKNPVESLMTKPSVNHGFTQLLPCRCSPMFFQGISLMAAQRKLCLSQPLNYQRNWMKYHQNKYRIINVKKSSHNIFNSFFLGRQFKKYKHCCQ